MVKHPLHCINAKKRAWFQRERKGKYTTKDKATVHCRMSKAEGKLDNSLQKVIGIVRNWTLIVVSAMEEWPLLTGRLYFDIPSWACVTLSQRTVSKARPLRWKCALEGRRQLELFSARLFLHIRPVTRVRWRQFTRHRTWINLNTK